jgi:hypothetical protein
MACITSTMNSSGLALRLGIIYIIFLFFRLLASIDHKFNNRLRYVLPLELARCLRAFDLLKSFLPFFPQYCY